MFANLNNMLKDLTVSSVETTETITSTTQCLSREDGQAKLAMMVGYIWRWLAHPKIVTCHSTNQVQCRDQHATINPRCRCRTNKPNLMSCHDKRFEFILAR